MAGQSYLGLAQLAVAADDEADLAALSIQGNASQFHGQSYPGRQHVARGELDRQLTGDEVGWFRQAVSQSEREDGLAARTASTT